ncbi:MAG: glycogen debranching N-terminal domain-containing protein [Solirubrobacteraceae bacterium]
MPDRTHSVLDGSTFVVGDRLGDICAHDGREHGFFAQDTRFISRWVLQVGSSPLGLLGLDQSSHFAAQFFLTPTVGPDEPAPCSIMRRRLIDHVWIEEITVTNHLHETSEFPVMLEIDTDFADLFEVKDGVVATRDVTCAHDRQTLSLDYCRGQLHRGVTIAASRQGDITRRGFAYAPRLAPGEQWSTTFTITFAGTPRVGQRSARASRRNAHPDMDGLRRAKADELAQWQACAPALQTSDPALARTYTASLGDLAALRMRPEAGSGATLPAAGLPWFMAPFGRDSLITSFQALPYLPSLAATTLRTLATDQAQTRDDFQEQEPGKILHELRRGELTELGLRPHSPYYGTADATPLFLILLGEYHRWTRDDELVRSLEPNARAALAWIDDSGDQDGDGYVEYARRNVASGLINQCWKDSWDSIQSADGTLARGPIATCEIQGYVYDARRRCAHLAREVWHDTPLAEKLDLQADELRVAFRRDFWMPERGCHALALDGDKRRVDSLTSNIGHLLWSGILDAKEATATVTRLFEDELYSGWGVRTLGARESGYNPLGYHTGTVWPHENSLIVAGLARYGRHDHAIQLAAAILRAAPHFEHRLPEVFAGFPAALTTVPVAFPTASRPQAWASGAPLLLLTTLLGLEPGDTEVHGDIAGGIGEVALTGAGRAYAREASQALSAPGAGR